MSILLKPIGGSYLLVALASLAVLALTVWAYRAQIRGTSGSWRWVAFGLRIAAVLLCLVAALRPSLMIDEKNGFVMSGTSIPSVSVRCRRRLRARAEGR